MERQRRISTFHMLSTNYRFHFAINLQETRTHARTDCYTKYAFATLLSSAEQDVSTIGHTRQEEDNHHRVDNGEPVNLDIAHGQVRVPSRRPLHLTLLHRQNETLSSPFSTFISSCLSPYADMKLLTSYRIVFL